MNITLLGYISRDTNTLPNGQSTEATGGKGLFTTAALARTGVTTDLITWLPEADAELLVALHDYPVTIHVIPIPTGTVNTNRHVDDSTIATTIIDPYVIEPKDLDLTMTHALEYSQVVHLAPDIQSKISLDTIRHLSDTLGLKISADAGKYYRTRQADGQLVPTYPWPEQARYLQYFDLVFLSHEDIEPMIAAGESLLSVARTLAEQGPNEIVITKGSQGSFIYTRDTNEAFDIPAYPAKQVIDPTGAGDTYIGAYLGHRFASDNVIAAGKFASMAASAKLAYAGPLQEPGEVIERLVAEQEE